MSDLASLMQIAPYAGSWMIGQKAAQDRQVDDWRMRELAQLVSQRGAQESRAADLHPYKLEEAKLNNQKTLDERPGVIGDANKRASEGRVATATEPARIAEANAKPGGEAHKRFMADLPAIGKQLESVPAGPGLRKQAFRTSLESRGITGAQLDGIMRQFDQVPEDQLPTFLYNLHKHSVENSPDYLKEKEKEAAAMARVQEQGKSQRQIQQMQIDAGKYDRKKQLETGVTQLEKMIANAKGARAQHAALNAAIEMAVNYPELAGKVAAWKAAAQAIEPQAAAEIAAANARPGEVDMGRATGLPINPPASIRPPPKDSGYGDSPGIAPQPGAAPAKRAEHSMAQLRAMYKGKSDDEIRRAYKQRFGVDPL